MKSWICAALLFFAVCSAAPIRATVAGSTSDCFAGQTRRVPGVEVYTFPKSPQLAGRIDAVLEATDANIFDRFDRLLRFVRTSKALAHVKSDNNGLFRAEVAADDELIVLGYLETEDNPLYWMHRYVRVDRQSSVSVALDYCRQP